MNYLKMLFSSWFPIRKEYLVKRIVEHPILFGILSLSIALLEVLFIVLGLLRFDFSRKIFIVYIAAYLALFAVSLFVSVFLFCVAKNARKYMKMLVVLSYFYAFALATFGYCITLLDYSRGTINFVTFTVLFMIIPVFCTLDPITYEGMLLSYTIALSLTCAYQFERDFPTGLILNLIAFGVAATLMEFTVYSDRVYFCNAEYRLTKLSRIDKLTGLMNHGTLDADLARAASKGGTYLYLMSDVDSFKKINDEFGHKKGDDVLSKIGDIMMEIFPGTSYRYGGDEMSVVASNLSIEEAVEKCRVINKRLAEEFGDFVRMTFGLYLGEPDPESRPDAPLQFADRALYSAKREKKEIAIYNLLMQEENKD